ncbi:MAG: universal stress protein [Candidatus Rokubacteria bacterium]|nr:universal stress protein [Candidatus Rokubacteria bacterium]
MKRIVVPLDASPVAESVLPVVADLARAGGGGIRLLRVEPLPNNCVDVDGRVVAYADQEMARLEAEGFDYLRSVATRLGGIHIESCVRFGDPLDEILKEADAFDADLIAVTTAGRSGLGRAVLGSVAERVFRKAETPVLLYRPSRADLA